MDNERKNLTDEELKAELNKGKTGKLGGARNHIRISGCAAAGKARVNTFVSC